MWTVSLFAGNSIEVIRRLTDILVAALAAVLVRDSLRLSPTLLLTFQLSNSSLKASEIDINGNGPHPAVTDPATNLTVIFDPHTFLPELIRAYEDHQILGPSTNDYLVYNYTAIDGVQFPQTFKVLYNQDLLFIQQLVDVITTNPNFTAGFFDGLPDSEANSTVTTLPPTVPAVSDVYTPAEVYESSYVLT